MPKKATAFAVALLVAGCGLSKDQAKQLIQEKYYDKDAAIYCTWDLYLNPPETVKGVPVYTTGADTRACLEVLQKAAFVEDLVCEPAENCAQALFVVSQSSNARVRLNKLDVPCGTKKLGNVVSVSTEGKAAKVRYKRTVTVDPAAVEKLRSCSLRVPKSGDEEQTMKFIKDDDGNWSPDE